MEQRLNFSMPQQNNSNSRARQNTLHPFHGHPQPIEEDSTLTIEPSINSLQCSSVLISWKVKQIEKIA